ncbi:uncharacterized protein [Coffea arabica]|uniref:Uncharacterized protein n=1 Tax=Coffea arabica TaxID=13443 RepID=A0A6P6WV81_COFAR
MGGIRTAEASREALSRGGRSEPLQVRGVPSNDSAVTPQITCGYCGKPNYSENECWRKFGKCLFCGSAEHQVASCPKAPKTGGNIQRSEKSTSKQTSAGGNRPKVPIRVYALDHQQIPDATEVVEDLKSSKLPYALEVRTPTRNQSLIANLVYRDCEIWIGEWKLMVDLIGLAIKGYDVILGMDWLAHYKAQLNCKTKIEELYIPGRENLEIECKSDKVKLEDMSVVKEFPDVFPEELESLPLEMNITFKIDVTPGVAPISKASYRMALVELKELKL